MWLLPHGQLINDALPHANWMRNRFGMMFMPLLTNFVFIHWCRTISNWWPLLTETEISIFRNISKGPPWWSNWPKVTCGGFASFVWHHLEEALVYLFDCDLSRWCKFVFIFIPFVFIFFTGKHSLHLHSYYQGWHFIFSECLKLENTVYK